MPGYKQSEVGVIPEDWRIVPLGSICDVRDGTHESPRFFKDGVPFVTSKNIVDGRLDLENVSFISKKDAIEFNKRSKVDRNDILLSMIGTIGSAALVDFDPAFCIKNVALIKPQKVTPTYLIRLINAPLFQNYLEGNLDGGIQKFISLGKLRKLVVPLPIETEQRAIAQALSDVDALLAALDKIIAKKRDLKQATMQRLLTGKTRLPGFSGEWRIRRLGEEATFHKGKGLPKSHITPFGSEPCIHYGELFTQYPEIIKEVFSSTDKQGAYFRSIANDVLMPTSDVTPRGLAKASCIQMDGVILGGDILVIRTDPSRVYGPFLSYVIRREEAQVLRLVTGTTVFHLYGADMKKFLFQLPPIDEQRAIACVLSDMDAELSALEARREKTRQLKQAMMQELLTGKTRLV